MFTVLYRDATGAERLYSAVAVRREATPDMYSIPPFGDVVVTVQEGMEVVIPRHRPNPDATRDEQLIAGGFEPRVFVMNVQGSTVATYSM